MGFILQEMVQTIDEEKTEEPDESLSFWELLKQSGLLRTGDSEIIVTGRPPYRLYYPLEGFIRLHETKKPPPVRRASVPAVLDVKLHSSAASSLKAFDLKPYQAS